MDIKVGHLPDPYQLDVAYVGGQPVGTVEKIVRDEPNPDWLGPYIRRALQEGFSINLRAETSEDRKVTGC
jgi:hypothetical protein|nr:MAG TPA: hypothetical protein [Caudoviricetes sp.]